MYEIQPIRVAFTKPINLKFCDPIEIIQKPVFDFSLLYPRKNGLRRKSKVCPFDTNLLIGIKDISF